MITSSFLFNFETKHDQTRFKFTSQSIFAVLWVSKFLKHVHVLCLMEVFGFKFEPKR
jgi:hypothetical protein